MSASETAIGFTNTTFEVAVNEAPVEIIDAQQQLDAKQKLVLVFRSKSTVVLEVRIADILELYNCTVLNKRGAW